MAKRIVKKAEERKAEILGVAQRLFFAQGYDNTSIADIILATGISKGAFYHHFASKDELLGGMVEQFRDQLIEQLGQIVDSDRSPLDKLNQIFRTTQAEKLRNIETLEMAFRTLFSDDNIKLRTRMMDNNFLVSLPLIRKVIAEGVSSGEFQSTDIDATAEFILVLGMYMGEQIAACILKRLENNSFDTLRQKVSHFERNVEGLLGLSPHSFVAIAPDVLQQLEAHFSQEVTA